MLGATTGGNILSLCIHAATLRKTTRNIFYSVTDDDARTAVDILPAYEDLFSSDLKKQVQLSRRLKEK